MAVVHEPSLASEAFRKHCVKDKMTCDLLMSNQILDVAIAGLESNSTVLRLQFDSIFPQMITVLPVCFQSFFPSLGDAKPTFVCPLEMFGLHLFDDSRSLIVDTWQPPKKGWFFLEVI